MVENVSLLSAPPTWFSLRANTIISSIVEDFISSWHFTSWVFQGVGALYLSSQAPEMPTTALPLNHNTGKTPLHQVSVFGRKGFQIYSYLLLAIFGSNSNGYLKIEKQKLQKRREWVPLQKLSRNLLLPQEKSGFLFAQKGRGDATEQAATAV